MTEDSRDILESDGEEPGFARKCRALSEITDHYKNRCMENYEKEENENENKGFSLRKCNLLGKKQLGSYENMDLEAEEAVILSQSSSYRGENSQKRKDEANCVYSDSENLSGITKPSTENNDKHWYSMGAKRLCSLTKLDRVSTSLNSADEALSDGSDSDISPHTNHDPLPSIHSKSIFSFLSGEQDLEKTHRVQNDILKLQENADLIRIDETSGSRSSRLSSLPDSVLQMAKEHTDFSTASGFGLDDGVDQDKNCSCFFCLKAAYLWSDLHYQDARGRLTALKRSRKQVKLLGGKFYDNGNLNRNNYNMNSASIGREYSNNSVGLESNLMRHWQSLFLHTEDALVNESSQLQITLYKLKELRRSCKMDLGRI